MTTTKTLRLRWLRFKRHVGTGPTYRRHLAARTRRDARDVSTHDTIFDFDSAAHGTRGLASSAFASSPRTLPGRQTWRGPAFALLALFLLTIAGATAA